MSGDATSAPASPGWYRTPEEALRRVAEGGARGLEREGKPPESFEYKAFRTHTLGSSSSRGVRGEDAGGDAGGGCFGALCGRRPRASPAAGSPPHRARVDDTRTRASRAALEAVRAELRRVEAALAESAAAEEEALAGSLASPALETPDVEAPDAIPGDSFRRGPARGVPTPGSSFSSSPSSAGRDAVGARRESALAAVERTLAPVLAHCELRRQAAETRVANAGTRRER